MEPFATLIADVQTLVNTAQSLVSYILIGAVAFPILWAGFLRK